MPQETKTNDKKVMENLLKTKSSFNYLPKIGEIAEGVIMEKSGSRIYVDLGLKGTGIIYGREYYESQNILKNLNPGDAITAKIIDTDNEEGFVELSLKEAGREKNWQELKDLMAKGETIAVKPQEANRGGLVIEYKGVKGFMPVSQLSSKNYPRVPGGDKEKIYEELKKFVNQETLVKIIDVNQNEEKLIFSEKSNESAQIQQKLSKYKVGDIIDGEITGIVNFGAFVTFDEGLEGLIHISEIDWQLIENPADVLKVGEKVQAKIIEMQSDKVALSLKALKEDPWNKVPEKYKKGEIVKGTPVKFNPFGAFVKLDDEIQGLLHISEFGNETKMKEEVVLNQEYELKILSIDAKEHRLGLGLPKNHPARTEETTVLPPEETPAEPVAQELAEPKEQELKENKEKKEE